MFRKRIVLGSTTVVQVAVVLPEEHRVGDRANQWKVILTGGAECDPTFGADLKPKPAEFACYALLNLLAVAQVEIRVAVRWIVACPRTMTVPVDR